MTGKISDLDGPVGIFVWVDSKMGGSERRFFRLFDYLQAQKVDVHLFTSTTGAKAFSSLGLRAQKNRVHALPSRIRPLGKFSRYPALFQRTAHLIRGLRKHKIRHLHFGGNPGIDTAMYVLFKKLACPFSVSLVDPVKDYQANTRRSRYTRITIRHCRRVDCLSEQIKNDLLSFIAEDVANKCLVSPCSFTDANAALSGETRNIDVAMVARMVPWKGHKLLQDALFHLEAENEDALIVYVCGSGPAEAEIRQGFDRITRHSVRIQFEEKPFEILSRSKIFVSIQTAENYPSQSLLEAMVSECAVIATDVGSTRQLLDESCAILIPPDAEMLANAIQTVLASETMRARLGANAAIRVKSTQTVERFARYFLRDIFASEEGPAPSRAIDSV